MALEVKRVRARGRGNSDPVRPLGIITSRKRARSASIESAMYDDDYQTYIKAHFDAGKRTQRPWTLDPPEQIFDARDLTGMFDVSMLDAYPMEAVRI